MDYEDKEKITRNLIFLKENIPEASLLKCIDYMIQEGVFSMEYATTIRTKTTTDEKCQTFIQDLIKSPPSSYGLFLESLRRAGCGHVRDILEGNSPGNLHYQTVQRLVLSKGAKRTIFYHITEILQYCLDKTIARIGDMYRDDLGILTLVITLYRSVFGN